MAMILLDTSFLFAYFHRKDIHHRKAAKWAKHLNNEQPFIPEDVLKELTTLITYKVSSQEAARVINQLVDPNGPVQILYNKEETLSQVLETFSRATPHRFSFVDVTLLTLARVYDCPIVTFDRRLEEEVPRTFREKV